MGNSLLKIEDLNRKELYWGTKLVGSLPEGICLEHLSSIQFLKKEGIMSEEDLRLLGIFDDDTKFLLSNSQMKQFLKLYIEDLKNFPNGYNHEGFETDKRIKRLLNGRKKGYYISWTVFH